MSLTAILLVSVPTAVVGGLLWFVADLKYAQRWGLRRSELGAQDDWRELNNHFEKGLRCRRPMLRLFQRFVLPGILEADYALHLSNQGEHDRGLALVKKASLKSARRPAIHLAILPGETLILTRLGQYDAARKVIRGGRDLLASPPPSLVGNPSLPSLSAGITLQEGLLELNLGHLDLALKLGIEATTAAVSDPARALVSGTLTAKGRFGEALEAMAYEPSTFSKFLTRDERDLLEEDKGFQESAQKMDEELSGVFGPAVEMGKALVHLEAGDTENLGKSLELTRRKLQAHKAMEHIFVRTRACWHAMKGDASGAETDLARARKLAADRPASRSGQYETNLSAGRVHLLLGESDKAIQELRAANELALHPMEKHVSLYWLARATQARNESLARSLFEKVIADGFQTWMETDARARSAVSAD